MNTKWIRPSASISYDVGFNTDGHTLEYSNLIFKYIEETVEERERGYAVVAKSEPRKFRIRGRFGLINLYFIESLCQYELEVRLDSAVISDHDFSKYRAILYGCLPIDAANVDSSRIEGALIGQLQRWLLHNFEIDAIRAAIGDFRTAKEVLSAREKIIETLLKQMHLLTSYGEDSSESPMNRKGRLILSSPVIREALQIMISN